MHAGISFSWFVYAQGVGKSGPGAGGEGKGEKVGGWGGVCWCLPAS